MWLSVWNGMGMTMNDLVCPSSSSIQAGTTSLYNMSALSPEYRTIQKNTSKIIDAIANQSNPMSFSLKLVENDLISGQSANSIVQTMGQPNFTKASQLMQAVESQIRTARDPTAIFETFLKILREVQLDNVADQLIDFYSKFQAFKFAVMMYYTCYSFITVYVVDSIQS